MLEQRYRSYYQKFFIDPILKIGCKFSPNIITIASGVVGLWIIPAVYFNYQWLAIFFLALSGYLDTLDGSVARAQNTSSQLGGALDIVIDRLVEGSVIFALFLVDQSRGIACFLMLFSNLICITSFLVVGIFVEQNTNKSRMLH
jgi:phosphatidylglycerophosphate synthase